MSMSQRLHARYLNRIHRQQRLLPFLFLHFDTDSGDLRSWFWPVTDSERRERVTPSDLEAYRATHEFRAPCCLCAAAGGEYTECAIYLAVQGQYAGEYVCGCAFDRCDYLVSLERMYTRRGLLVDVYPLRPAGQAAPLSVRYLPYVDPGRFFAVNRPRGHGLVSLPVIQMHRRPTRRRDISDLILRLDSRNSPGLPEAQFKSIFTQCECGLVMTRRVVDDHTCAVPTVIDLTLDDDDDSGISVPVIIDLTGDSDDSY